MCRAELPPGLEKLHDDAMRRFIVLYQRYGQGRCKRWRRVSNDGDRRELAEVMRMMHEAAEQGNADAQFNLGIMYDDHGQGVDQSHAIAVKWYRKAAEQGLAKVQCNLGFMYKKGRCVGQSDATACATGRRSCFASSPGRTR